MQASVCGPKGQSVLLCVQFVVNVSDTLNRISIQKKGTALKSVTSLECVFIQEHAMVQSSEVYFLKNFEFLQILFNDFSPSKYKNRSFANEIHKPFQGAL